jgi:hypothetical protein
MFSTFFDAMIHFEEASKCRELPRNFEAETSDAIEYAVL